MRKIPLTKGYIALVDDSDYESLIVYKWCAQVHAKLVYAVSGSRRMHRIIMPGVRMVDHRDGDGLNNQRYNLRPCNHVQNGHNARTSSRVSGLKGVYKAYGDNWRRSISVNKQFIHLGYSKDKFYLAHMYDEAAIRYFGEFARTNESMGLLN